MKPGFRLRPLFTLCHAIDLGNWARVWLIVFSKDGCHKISHATCSSFDLRQWKSKTCSYGDAMWLLKLDYKRWFKLHLILLECLPLEICVALQSVWLPWGDHAMRKPKLAPVERHMERTWEYTEREAQTAPSYSSSCYFSSSLWLTAVAWEIRSEPPSWAQPKSPTHRNLTDNKMIVVLRH